MRCVISDAIEKVFVSFFFYLGYRRFVSRVQVLPAVLLTALLYLFSASTSDCRALPCWNQNRWPVHMSCVCSLI